MVKWGKGQTEEKTRRGPTTSLIAGNLLIPNNQLFIYQGLIYVRDCGGIIKSLIICYYYRTTGR
jgi:hypothetical protein